MNVGAALVAVALWLLVGSAHAQEPVPFDYRCDAAAAAATPDALPADGWLRANGGKLPRAAGSPCWLRVDVARLAPRVLSVGRLSPLNITEVAVYSRDGRPLAFAGRPGPRDEVLVGNEDGTSRGLLFPTLRAEDGPVLMRVQHSYGVTLTAVHLVPSVLGEQHLLLVHLAVGVLYLIVTLVATALGVFGRDRGQFVFAALFAWLAIVEWGGISPSLPAALASGVWPPAVWDSVYNMILALAAAQLLQLRERAPRWNRWMMATGVWLCCTSHCSSRCARSPTRTPPEMSSGPSSRSFSRWLDSRRRGMCGGSVTASESWAPCFLPWTRWCGCRT